VAARAVTGGRADPELRPARILILDDEPDQAVELEARIRKAIDAPGGGRASLVDSASTDTQAIELVSRNFYSAAIVDFKLVHAETGAKNAIPLLKHLRDESPSTRRILISAEVPDHWDRFNEIFGSDPLTDHMFIRQQEPWAAARIAVGTLVDSRWALERCDDLERLCADLDARRRSKHEIPPHAAYQEIPHLLGRIYRKRVDLGNQATPTLKLTKITEGRSSCGAYVVNASADLNGSSHRLVRTLLKAGPRAEIEAEVLRYRRYVQLGVATFHRVDLIGAAYGRHYAVAAFSFVGDADQSEVVALAKLSLEPARSIYGQLFNAKTKSWYATRSEAQSNPTYWQDVHQFPVQTLSNQIDALAGFMSDVAVATKRGNLSFGDDRKYPLPSGAAVAKPPLSTDRKACLVHGDLHPNNVLVHGGEANPWPVIIDYGSVDFGPRVVDFAVAECTIWTRDEMLVEMGIDPERVLEPAEQRSLVAKLLPRIAAFAPVDQPDDPRPVETWADLAYRIRDLALENFADLDRHEYFCSLFVYAARRFGYEISESPERRELERLLVATVALAAYSQLR
jgi:hypothetical protein